MSGIKPRFLGRPTRYLATVTHWAIPGQYHTILYQLKVSSTQQQVGLLTPQYESQEHIWHPVEQKPVPDR